MRADERGGHAVAQLTGVCFGKCRRIGPVVERTVGGHHDAKGVSGDVANVLGRIPID